MSTTSREPLPTRVQQRIAAQIELSRRALAAEAAPLQILPFVTVSRQFGCQAVEFSHALGERLSLMESAPLDYWQVYSREIMESLVADAPLAERLVQAVELKARGGVEEFFQGLIAQEPNDISLLRHLFRIVRALAVSGHSIIVGRGGAIVTRDLAGGMHIRLVASEAWRMDNLTRRHGWDPIQAELKMREAEAFRTNFFKKYVNQNPDDPIHYDLVLNVERLSRVEQIECVAALFRLRFPQRVKP